MAGYIGSGASVVSSGAERKKVFDITTNTTSLTGLNYTVGKVHVYHNGVRLVDGTDYTATNSTSITLTVAAVSGDQVVVVSYASYQVALSGIDDQSNAVALTIDSSENVLIGKTTTSFGTQGVALRNNRIQSTNDGGSPLELNRLTSDGDIALFQKDGSTVGSIGASGGNLIVQGSTSAGKTGIKFGGSQWIPQDNGNSDGGVDLGISSVRFKDAYLSGGIYLGGVGSANKLDSYEEGTWNVTDSSGAGLTFTVSNNSYTKVGRLVVASAQVTWPTTSNTALAKLSVPFTSITAGSEVGGMVTEQNYDSSVALSACLNTTTQVFFRSNGVTALRNNQLAGKKLRFTVVYHAS